MDRRTFLKLAGTSSLMFGAACTSRPAKNLYTLVNAPDDMVTGNSRWYASTCRECPAGCGILAKNREGRTIKLEGNPLHPINRGKLCMRGQAALQGVYNPDRLFSPMVKKNGKFETLSVPAAFDLLHTRIQKPGGENSRRPAMVTGMVGRELLDLFSMVMDHVNAPAPLVFEPMAHEALRAAHETVFGIKALPAYHMEKADLIVGFGADFLKPGFRRWNMPANSRKCTPSKTGARTGFSM